MKTWYNNNENDKNINIMFQLYYIFMNFAKKRYIIIAYDISFIYEMLSHLILIHKFHHYIGLLIYYFP